MELDFHQLDFRYQELRIRDTARIARLVSSISDSGQQSPVLVVKHSKSELSYILIDGYLRVEALRRLGADQVKALLMPYGEAEALLVRYHLNRESQRSALEDGWFLHELVESHGFSQEELTSRLGRSKSWVSRRISLVVSLPQEVQKLVREGSVCAHAAQKYLVPLARANQGHCIQIAQGLSGKHPSSRQMHALYLSWRKGSSEQREKIVQSPGLFLKVTKSLEPPTPDPRQDYPVAHQLGILKLSIQITMRCIRNELTEQGGLSAPDLVKASWITTQQSFQTLSHLLEEERFHA